MTRTATIAAAALAAPLFAAPTHPEGTPTPRSLTAEERAYIAEHPITAPAPRATAPPTGAVRAVAEYEPMEAIILAWEGSGGWKTILEQMAVAITTAGDADVWVYCDSGAERDSVSTRLANAGADMARVYLPVKATDTIWCRDYGPQYVYEHGVRAAVDHTYNRPRPNDNTLPADYANRRGHLYYDAPLVHGGGNYHLVADATGYATELIDDENPGLSESDIIDVWADYWGVLTTITDALPSFVDSTQHIDMWMQMCADDHVVISDWPAQPGTAQDIVCDTWAAELASRGFTVTRVPARTVSGTHYTYTNVVICNDLVLVPTYTNSTIVSAGYNADALAAWASVFPSKTIVDINCQSIVTAAGVMHCITKHIPANSGGESPVAHLRAPNGGESYLPGDPIDITWISDDDSVLGDDTVADIDLSLDNGATWQPVTTGTPDDGLFSLPAPDAFAPQAIVRVTVRDSAGNTGADQSDAAFAINGAPCPADCDGNGTLNVDDVDCFVAGFLASDPATADCDDNGALNVDDVDCFVASFLAGCP
ncbi:MAG: agmatine deiminase family protein [Phycisphaerales bacterium]